MAPPGGTSTSPEVAMDINSEAKNDSGSIPIITSVNVIKKVSSKAVKTVPYLQERSLISIQIA